ncbi:MAG: SCO family protein [Sphingobacteriales bacterium]
MKIVRVLKKILILVLVLAVPGFLYYLLVVEGKNRYHALPVFGPKEIAKTTHRVKGKDIPDTIYHTLPDFKLTDQNGNPVSLKTFDGKIFVAGFFYTHCPSVCKLINSNINLLASAYAKIRMVDFVSITVDPERDSPQVLKQYANTFNPVSKNWLFLSGDTSTVYKLARNGFLVNALQTGKDDFIYSDKLVLIDQERRIRGYYTGASTDDVNRLNDEIKVLISEEINKHDKPLY